MPSIQPLSCSQGPRRGIKRCATDDDDEGVRSLRQRLDGAGSTAGPSLCLVPGCGKPAQNSQGHGTFIPAPYVRSVTGEQPPRSALAVCATHHRKVKRHFRGRDVKCAAHAEGVFPKCRDWLLSIQDSAAWLEAGLSWYTLDCRATREIDCRCSGGRRHAAGAAAARPSSPTSSVSSSSSSVASSATVAAAAALAPVVPAVVTGRRRPRWRATRRHSALATGGAGAGAGAGAGGPPSVRGGPQLDLLRGDDGQGFKRARGGPAMAGRHVPRPADAAHATHAGNCFNGDSRPCFFGPHASFADAAHASGGASRTGFTGVSKYFKRAYRGTPTTTTTTTSTATTATTRRASAAGFPGLELLCRTVVTCLDKQQEHHEIHHSSRAAWNNTIVSPAAACAA